MQSTCIHKHTNTYIHINTHTHTYKTHKNKHTHTITHADIGEIAHSLRLVRFLAIFGWLTGESRAGFDVTPTIILVYAYSADKNLST